MTSTTTASTTTTTSLTNSTTRQRGACQGKPPAERSPPRESTDQRPRPRRGGLGLGAAGALLRAAGALPRTGRRERKAQEVDPPREVPAQAATAVVEHDTNTTAALESPAVVANCEPIKVSSDTKNSSDADQDDGVSLTCCRSSIAVETSLPSDATDTNIDDALTANVSSEATEFLEYCLGGSAALLEMEMDFAANEDGLEESFFSIEQPSEDIAEDNGRGGANPCQEFSMLLNPSSGEMSDSEDDVEGNDLEDMFDFDPTRLADLMNSGASMEELTDHLQESYARAFEHRLSMDNKTEAHEEADSCADDARPQLQMGELTPLMTPEHVSPLVTPKGAACPHAISEHAEQALEEVATRRSERARRSLAMQHRPSATQRGGMAVKAMEAFGRRSLARVSGATAEDREQLEDAVVDAMRRASRRHRRSVAKAAEVLEEVAEVSNVPLDAWSESQIDDKVEVVQKAMEEAHRQHRRSITAAVHDVVTGTVEQPAEADATKDSIVEIRIREAVLAAHKRRTAHTEQSQWEGQLQEGGSRQWQQRWREEQQSDWQEHWQEEEQNPWAGQWHGEEQNQWAEQWHEEPVAQTDAWSAEYPTYVAESYTDTYVDAHCGTGNIAWNGLCAGYESTPKQVEWNAHASRLRAPWRYGSA